MTFKKHKIITPGTEADSILTSIRDRYRSIRDRNSLLGFGLGFTAVVVIGLIGLALLVRIPSFTFSADSIMGFLPSSLTSVFAPSAETLPPRINILITGMGGGTHDGADLTDTIMLASLDTRHSTVSLFSIPRDLYVQYPMGGAGKINGIFPIAQQKYSHEDAMRLLAKKVTEVTGQPIDHFFNIDFDGFTHAIDILGGVEVDVPTDLVDNEYPDEENDRYVTFSIKKWLQTLDGATALKYARSRHSTNDFDRSMRQGLIIKAVKAKLLSMGTLTNPSRIKALYSTLSDHVFTDMPISDILSLGQYFRSLDPSHIVAFSLNDSCYPWSPMCQRWGFMYIPSRELFGGASVVIPIGSSGSGPRQYAPIILYATLACDYADVFIEDRPIVLVNASHKAWLVEKYILMLKKYGFNIPDKHAVFSTKDPYPHTTVFYPPETQTGVTATGSVNGSILSGILPGSTGSETADTTGVQTPHYANRTLEALSLFFYGPQVAEDRPRYATGTNGPTIEIVLGDDAELFLH